MRVPRELERLIGSEVDAVAAVQTSLTRSLGTLWFVAVGGRLQAFELAGLLGEPKAIELAGRAPLALEGEGLDRQLRVRTADGAEHVVKPWSWELAGLAEVIGRTDPGAPGASPAPASAGARPALPAVATPPPVRPSQPVASPFAPVAAASEPVREPEPPEPEWVPLPPPPEPRRPRPQVQPLAARPQPEPEPPRFEARLGVPASGPRPRPRRRGKRFLVMLALVGGGAGAWVALQGVIAPAERCGDGIVSAYDNQVEIEAPLVTNLRGATGPVCDDGGSGSSGTFDVSENGYAPEHGICQALGFERAISVTWGGGPGESAPVMPHADNWMCADFSCVAGSETAYDNCSQVEMLAAITCERRQTEACDMGEANSDAPGAPCRLDCTLPRCGDGVADPGEECDDGNDVAVDACTNTCALPACGDGILQMGAGEFCDDGALADGDGCSATCQREVGACRPLIVSDDSTALAGIAGLLTGVGLSYDIVQQPGAPLDAPTLAPHDFVILYQHSRAMPQAEADALQAWLAGGNRLLYTGYDSMTRADNPGAALVGLRTAGDGPWETRCAVAGSESPALNGRFGNWARGYEFLVTESDHDRISPSPGATTTALIALADGTPKLTVAHGIGGRGVAYFWNGNRYGRDWTSPGTAQNIFFNLLVAECTSVSSGSRTTPDK